MTLLLWALSLALLATAAWLFLLDPTVPRPQVGPDAGCSAAYDTVLNDADNVPGGERAVDAEDVGKACRQVGKEAFAAGVGLVVAAAVLGACTALRALRTRRREAAEAPGGPVLVGLGIHLALVVAALCLGAAAYLAVGAALEDAADLRMGDVLVGWVGYVAAGVFTGLGVVALVSTTLGPRLQRRGEASAPWVLALPSTTGTALLAGLAALRFL